MGYTFKLLNKKKYMVFPKNTFFVHTQNNFVSMAPELYMSHKYT